MNKQFTRKEKAILIFLALLLVAGAYYWLVQLPVSEELTEISYAQQDAETQITVLAVKEQRLNDMRAELEQIFAAPSHVETPDYNNLEQLMAFLNTILASTEDYSLNFQQVDSAGTDLVVRRVISMNFTCSSYALAKQTVQNLHDSPYRCQLGSLSLTPIQVQASAAAQPAATPRASTQKTAKKAAATPAPTPEQTQQAGTGVLAGPIQVSLTITFYEAL